jgi:pSer/pThr/pTyr-binding forkhead associated (FHA) protein
MAEITLRILDGADRGRVYEGLPTPVTIGREEGNSIQINDERISRFHIKIQEDHDKIVLTDLESTNGTKVNGEDIQLRILRYGDMIAMGRSVLLFGSREQITQRIGQLRGDGDNRESLLLSADSAEFSDSDLDWENNPDLQSALQQIRAPELPDRLSPAQAAQFAEIVDYIHLRLRRLLATVEVNERSERVTLDAAQWQTLLDLQSELAMYFRNIGEPEG